MKQRIPNQKITKNIDGREVYASAIPGQIETSLSDIVIIANEVTRLDLLAHLYLGNRDLWWMIAAANGIANGGMHVRGGTELVIPLSELKR